MKKERLPRWAKGPIDNIHDLPGEIWQCPAKYLFNDERGLVEFPFLAVSNLGRVKSIRYQKWWFTGRRKGITTHNAKLLKIKPNDAGYAIVEFRATIDEHKNKKYSMLVGRMVLSSFVTNPDPKRLLHAGHRNENPMDSRLENMEWQTPKENNNYGNRNKRVSKSLTGHKRGPEEIEKMAMTKRKPVIANGKWYKSLTDAAAALGIHASNLCRWMKTGIPENQKGLTIAYVEESDNEIR